VVIKLNENKKIREIESEIDNYYKKFPLLKEKESEAIWYLLVAHDYMLRDYIYQTGDESGDLNIKFKNGLMHSLKWVTDDCYSGSFSVPKIRVGKNKYKKAKKLFDLACDYDTVFAAFTSWSRDRATAELIDNKTIDFEMSDKHISYDLLDRLLFMGRTEVINTSNSSEFQHIINRIKRSIDVKALEYIEYKVSKRDALTLSNELYIKGKNRFILPDSWGGFGIKVDGLRKIFAAIRAISVVHVFCHFHVLEDKKIVNGARSSMIMVKTKNEWISLIKKYTDFKITRIERIFDFLIYDKEYKKRDISLQPFIYLDNEYIALSPMLIQSNYFERNFIQLLAKIEEYSDEYNATTEMFEEDMTKELEDFCQSHNLLICKNVNFKDSLPDLDIGIYDKETKSFFIGELKWTIPAADPDEVINKNKNIERKGISQAMQLLEYARQNKNDFWEKCFSNCGIPEDISYSAGIICKGYVGSDYEIDLDFAKEKMEIVDKNIADSKIRTLETEINIIEINLFKKHLDKYDSLLKTIEWIRNESFLPEPGVDFETISREAQFGPYKIYWVSVKIDKSLDKSIPGLR